MISNVGLCMIVKNEEDIIERSIRSAAPFIENWVIVDTGSSDKTKEIISRVFSDLKIPGVIYDREWVNFGHNRTEALELSRGHMKWAIMLDADDTLEGEPINADIWGNNIVDGYTVQLYYHGQCARRPQIFRLSSGWKYIGAIHEVATIPGGGKIAPLPSSTYMTVRTEGARSKDPDRFKKDAELLLQEHYRNPTNEHTIYHLANSYRSAKMFEQAIEYYKKCVELPNAWIQCKYMACVNIIYYSSSETEKINAAIIALGYFPNRLEAQYALLKQTWNSSFEKTVYEIASSSKNRAPDLTGYLVHPELYDWKLDWELSIFAFNLKDYQEAYEAAIRCLLNCPEVIRSPIIEIAKLALASAHM